MRFLSRSKQSWFSRAMCCIKLRIHPTVAWRIFENQLHRYAFWRKLVQYYLKISGWPLGVIQQLRGQLLAIFPPPSAWTVLIPLAWTKTNIFDPLPPHFVHVVIEWPLSAEVNRCVCYKENCHIISLQSWITISTWHFPQKIRHQITAWTDLLV